MIDLLRLTVFTYFTLWENPGAIYLVLAMPTLMIMFLTCYVCRYLENLSAIGCCKRGAETLGGNTCI